MRVVVAEDSVLFREGLVRLLEDAGVEVAAQARDAHELRTSVEREQPDVAIVDVRMPPTQTDEGTRVAREIRAEHPGVAVLVLSQTVEVRHALDALQGSSELWQSRCRGGKISVNPGHDDFPALLHEYLATAIADAASKPKITAPKVPIALRRRKRSASALRRSRSFAAGDAASLVAMTPSFCPAGRETNTWIKRAMMAAVPPSEKVRPTPVCM